MVEAVPTTVLCGFSYHGGGGSHNCSMWLLISWWRQFPRLFYVASHIIVEAVPMTVLYCFLYQDAGSSHDCSMFLIITRDMKREPWVPICTPYFALFCEEFRYNEFIDKSKQLVLFSKMLPVAKWDFDYMYIHSPINLKLFTR